MNQKQFASLLGITQSGVSYMEQDGSNVSDSSIKTICSILGLSEDWLRYGTEPMYIKNDIFSLDNYLKSRSATDLEIEIIKAYFDLTPDIRDAVLNHFMSRLSPQSPGDSIPAATTEELEEEYKKNRLNSVSKTTSSALNIISGTPTKNA